MIERSRRASRTQVEIAGHREGAAIAATLGGQIRVARRARHMTLTGLAARTGIGRTRLSEIERGQGARVPLETWIVIDIALDKAAEAAATWPADFPGSSRAWLRALTVGMPPPPGPGLVRYDPARDALTEHRRATIAS